MKTLFGLMVIFFSFKSLAHTCHISLYDPNNRPYLNFHSENDINCQQAAQSCYQAISQYRLNPYHYKCYTISMTEVRRDLADQDYRRAIEMGESVFYNGKYGVATFLTADGLYEFLPEGKKKRDIEKNIERKDLAITRGCLRGMCTKTSAISKSTRRYVSVEGINYHGRYIIQDVASKEFSFNVEFFDLAKTKGCVKAHRGEVCAGNAVLSQDRRNFNRYYQVAGIQSEGLIVLMDQEGVLHFNIDPNSVTVTR